MCAITGITGKLGGFVARNLLSAGQPVRAVDVVQIAGPRAFAERTQLFSEDLFIRVTKCVYPSVRLIGVRVAHRPCHGGFRYEFIRRQIELHSRKIVPTLELASIVEPALAGPASARVVIDVKS